jgi:UDP-2,3-diacylglucosamine pyrophosphatase LpxH
VKIFFISDVHASNYNKERLQKLLLFLDLCLKEEIDVLIILGDFFEFLYGDASYAENILYKDVFDKLEILTKKNIRIIYLYGNHDFNFSLNPKYKIEVYSKLKNINLDGFNAYLFHGDGLDPLDVKYRLLKAVVRSSVFTLLVKILPIHFYIN